jgi:glycosyltransferase involved in cell wall biosynthesis
MNQGGASFGAAPGTMRPLARRVLHVMRMSGVGGSENHLSVLLPELPALGWEPDVLIPSPSPPAIRGLAESFAKSCRRVTVVPMRADLSPSLPVRIGRLLRSGEYQIVHSHLVHADWYVAVASVTAPGVALVSTKHNEDRFRRTYPFRLIERVLSNRCAATITISEALRDFTLRYSPPRTPVSTVLYGLKAPPGAPERSSEFDSPTLLAVGRLVQQKGLDILIQAMRPIKVSAPDARLLLAGDGPERQALERLARDLELVDSVSFLGHSADVDHLMRRAWILVHPSRWEGFGLVLLEAMRQGLPIVAARVSALPEIVIPGVTGLLVPPGDPQALAEAAIRALGDERFRREAGMRGFERLVERFSAERMARETAAIYDRAANAARSAAWRGTFLRDAPNAEESD